MGRLGDAFRRALGALIRALLPRSGWLRWVLLALPVVLLLWLLLPAVNVLARLFELLLELLQPMLETTFGRILLLLVSAALLPGLAAVLLRGRIREFRARLALGRHLQATAALLTEDGRRARDRFAKLASYRGPLPAEYDCLAADAALKAARLALDAGDPNDALAWLTRVVEKGLPEELRRSLLQLRICALQEQGLVLDETLEAEIDRALESFPDDYELACRKRDLMDRLGRPADALAAHERAYGAAPFWREATERQSLAARLLEAGSQAIEKGDLDGARRAAKRLRAVDRKGPGAGLLAGKILAAKGDLRGAIREWGATRSPEGLDRIAEALAASPGILSVRELVECCPMQGTLLLVAKELARRGEREQAERAASAAAERLGPTPSVCGALVEVLDLLGKNREADLLCRQAIERLIAPPGAPG